MLARLRYNLDFMPSPVPDQPGLLVRDSYKYSDVTLIIPPVLVETLQCFDGQHSELDLRSELVRLTGQLQVSDIANNLVDTLSRSGFLENQVFEELRAAREREFAESPIREPAHIGTAYPVEPEELRAVMREYMGENAASNGTGGLRGIAAPHVSPEGGWQSYRAAYRNLNATHRERTFVILGTSHYGQPERFGLTRKSYVTPLGEARVNERLFAELSSQPAAILEDYCHSIEHSIEFQVLFLQWLYGPEISILPVLCGSFAQSIYHGGMPEDDEGVKSFLATLGGIAARESDRLFWVLGVDMAHMGRRYGDAFVATADRGEMTEVGARDAKRIAAMGNGSADDFWNQVQENHDDLKWCGSSPIYTFLRAVPEARGLLHRYEQWNIDEQSVVSFAGMSFE